jgi:predicted metal-dependent peptidase
MYRDLTAEQQVQKCTLDVITHIKYRAMAGVIMLGVTRVEDDPKKCPSAYTDGLNKTYGRKFVAGLTEQELRFVILHEAMHVALRHLITWVWMWKDDPDLANKACDYVINLLLVLSDADEGFIRMPKGGCLDMRFKGMDSGEVFRLLKQEKESGKGSAGDGEPGGFDQHGWDEAKSRTADEAAGVERQVADAMQQGSLFSGVQGGELPRVLGELRAPAVDWADAMREFIVNLCSGREISTWRRPNRRSIDSGVYTPSSYSEAVGRIGIGIDTSGSVGGAVLTRFLSEVVGVGSLVHPESIDLLYWDSKVAGHEIYGPGQYNTIPQSTKPKGGGGTRPSCVTTYLQEKKIKPECVIMLTDGAVGSDWGKQWPCPVLWCIVGNKRVTAGTGKTVHVNKN